MNQAGRDLAGISEVFAEADEEIGPVAKAAVGVMDAIGVDDRVDGLPVEVALDLGV